MADTESSQTATTGYIAATKTRRSVFSADDDTKFQVGNGIGHGKQYFARIAANTSSTSKLMVTLKPRLTEDTDPTQKFTEEDLAKARKETTEELEEARRACELEREYSHSDYPKVVRLADNIFGADWRIISIYWGRNVRDSWGKNTSDESKALDVLGTLKELQKAHAAGIIHGDPHFNNVIRCNTHPPHYRFIDFGNARRKGKPANSYTLNNIIDDDKKILSIKEAHIRNFIKDKDKDYATRYQLLNNEIRKHGWHVIPPELMLDESETCKTPTAEESQDIFMIAVHILEQERDGKLNLKSQAKKCCYEILNASSPQCRPSLQELINAFEQDLVEYEQCAIDICLEQLQTWGIADTSIKAAIRSNPHFRNFIIILQDESKQYATELLHLVVQSDIEDNPLYVLVQTNAAITVDHIDLLKNNKDGSNSDFFHLLKRLNHCGQLFDAAPAIMRNKYGIINALIDLNQQQCLTPGLCEMFCNSNLLADEDYAALHLMSLGVRSSFEEIRNELKNRTLLFEPSNLLRYLKDINGPHRRIIHDWCSGKTLKDVIPTLGNTITLLDNNIGRSNLDFVTALGIYVKQVIDPVAHPRLKLTTEQIAFLIPLAHLDNVTFTIVYQSVVMAVIPENEQHMILEQIYQAAEKPESAYKESFVGHIISSTGEEKLQYSDQILSLLKLIHDVITNPDSTAISFTQAAFLLNFKLSPPHIFEAVKGRVIKKPERAQKHLNKNPFDISDIEKAKPEQRLGKVTQALKPAIQALRL